MNIDEFINIIIPSMLTNMQSQNYYIKGGKCYDVYFKNTTNSKDWDLVTDSKTLDYILEFMKKYAANFNTQVLQEETLFPNLEGDNEPLIHLGFKDFSTDIDPFLLDITVRDTDLEYTTLNSLNYMTIFEFVQDIIITYKNRAEKVQKYTSDTDILDDVNNDVKSFNNRYKQTMDIISAESCREIVDKTRSQFILYLQSNSLPKIKKLYEKFIQNILKFDSDDCLDYDSVYKNIDIEDVWCNMSKTEEEDENFEQIQAYVSDYFNDIIYGWITYKLAMKEKKLNQEKYEKTSKRIGNVIDISWDNLSELYKKYLLTECHDKDKVSLFNISDTCQAYLTCDTKSIIKSTKTCKPK